MTSRSRQAASSVPASCLNQKGKDTRSDNTTFNGHGMPDPLSQMNSITPWSFLNAIINADDETTIGEIRPFADALDALVYVHHRLQHSECCSLEGINAR